MRKTFGSDEVFLMIEQNIINEDNEQWYEELYEIVTEQCKRILLRDYRMQSVLTEDDLEDVAQIVNMKVCQHLVEFYFHSITATEAQRNAWLKTIVKHAAEDYIRKEKKRPTVPLYPKRKPSSTNKDDPQDAADLQSALTTSVKHICQMPTSAQNIIAFLLGKISVVFASGRNSVSAKELIRQLDGKTLFDAFRRLELLLCEICEDDMSNNGVFDGLVEKLNLKAEKGLVGDQKFDMSAKQISNALEWFRRKLSVDFDFDDFDQI